MESLYEAWAKRNPSWERRYQSTVVDVFCDYGKGVSSFLEARGKYLELVMKFLSLLFSSDYIIIEQNPW